MNVSSAVAPANHQAALQQVRMPPAVAQDADAHRDTAGPVETDGAVKGTNVDVRA
jgi:hypothetical protein